MAGLEKSEILVLIPAYNEARNIARVVGQAVQRGFPVLVVDDGSFDATAKNAKSAGAQILMARQNTGKGATLRRGFEWFLQTRYKAVILMDADGQHDPRELEVFVTVLEKGEHAVVLGNRMQSPVGMPWIRRATNRSMSWIISKVAGQSIPDSQCGYRALAREAVENLRLRTNRYETDSEVLLKAAAAGFHIGSVPVSSFYRGERSQIHPIVDTFRFFRFLFSYLWLRC